MSQGASFKIKIPETSQIDFNQDETFENFIGQFQPFCSKLLCIIDGTLLRYYDKPASLPKNIRFDYKQHRHALTEYYFRDIETDSLYCVFGRDAALIFYPRLNEIDPSPVPVGPPVSLSLSAPLALPAPLAPLAPEINSYRSVPGPVKILPSVEPPVRSLIPEINSRRHHSVPDSVGPSNQHHLPSHRHVSAPEPRQFGSTRTPIIRPIQPPAPSEIVVVDEGVKLTFPNPNYPVAIQIFRPELG